MRNNKMDKKSLQDAIWQYLIEHSKQTSEGYWHINFIAKSKYKFFCKVRGREKGWIKPTTGGPTNG